MTRGFFIQRECGKPAVGACEDCGKRLCVNHQVFSEGRFFCRDCASNRGIKEDSESPEEGGWADNHHYAEEQRRSYYGRGYSSSSYYGWGGFTESDASAFEPGQGEAYDAGHEGDVSAFDS